MLSESIWTKANRRFLPSSKRGRQSALHANFRLRLFGGGGWVTVGRIFGFLPVDGQGVVGVGLHGFLRHNSPIL